MHRLALLVATCGCIGYVPVAPGTFGAAAGLALLWAVRREGGPLLEVAVILALVGVGVWSATVVERHTGRTDPGIVVIDEAAGMLITMFLVPWTMATVVVGFLLFRVLDILKPWPARQFERLRGGLGVMADDTMVAVYGNLVMHGLVAVAPGWFE